MADGYGQAPSRRIFKEGAAMSSAKCCVCTDEFPGIDDLEAHISADHYNCLPFECEKCKFAKFPTEFAIKRHYEEDHGLVEYFIRYRVSREIYEKKQKIRECLERCIRHSDISSGQHQIALANRNIIGGDYASSSHAHYQSRQQQLHESEFLTPPTKIRTNHAELFSNVQQQPHGPLLSSSAADIRHQHQSDFGAVDNDPISGYESIGGPNHIGSLLEQIKPDVDAGPLSHFDQLYAAEVTTASEGPRGIEKYITTQSQSTSQEPLSFLAQQKPHNTTGSNNIITVGGTPTPPIAAKQNGSNTIEISVVPAKVSFNKRPAELQCQECKRMVVNRSTSLMYHVNVKHLKLAMFKCRSCGEEFLWNKSAAVRHAQRHGGDESLIENNSDRLFPTLNQHRREYFKLGKREPEDSATPPFQQQSGQDEEPNKRARISHDGMEKEEDGVEEDDKDVIVENVDGNSGHDLEDNKKHTPSSILAQLVDMTRGTQSEKGIKMSAASNGSSGPSISYQRGAMTTENRNQKPIQCNGCGDLVINQEWILLNHVNTKHLHLPLYKCISCNKPFENYLRSYAVRHAKFYHAGDESLLLDQREMFCGELRDACSRLFEINKTSVETS